MPLLITEAQKLSNTDLIRGIVEEIIDVDDTFSLLPFVYTEGKTYTYNRENVLAGADFSLPNVDVEESATSFTEVSATLRILIGDVDVDNFLAATMSDVNDQKAVQVAHKAKAVARKFSDTFINGDTTTVYNLATRGGADGVTNVQFDGIDKLTPAGQVLAAGANGGVLTFDLMDSLLDQVKLGADVLVMSKRTIRDYKKLLRSLSSVTPEYVQLSNGRNVIAYAGTPILRNDFIRDNDAQGTSGNVCSTVFAARFNEVDGVHGVYGGPTMGFAVQEIGQLEKRDATRTRVKWYCTIALKATHSLARLDGVLSA